MERDQCEFCLGHKGGVHGNENVVHGAVCCDYCHPLVTRVVGAAVKAALDEALNSGDGVYRP